MCPWWSSTAYGFPSGPRWFIQREKAAYTLNPWNDARSSKLIKVVLVAGSRRREARSFRLFEPAKRLFVLISLECSTFGSNTFYLSDKSPISTFVSIHFPCPS